MYSNSVSFTWPLSIINGTQFQNIKNTSKLMKALFKNICIKTILWTRNTNCFTIFVHGNFRRKGHSKLWVSYCIVPRPCKCWWKKPFFVPYLPCTENFTFLIFLNTFLHKNILFTLDQAQVWFCNLFLKNLKWATSHMTRFICWNKYISSHPILPIGAGSQCTLLHFKHTLYFLL